MKNRVLISMLLIAGLILSSCSKKNDSTTTTTTTSNLVQGKYPATGTVTLTCGGANYSMPMKSVQIVTTEAYSVIINALDSTLVTNFGTIVIQINAPTLAGLTTGTYKIPGPTGTYNLINFTDKTITAYTAGPTITGTSATINITTLTSTSIQGTFTATLVPLKNNSGPSISLVSGVINCTY